MTNILEINRERLFAAMTREESDASPARAGAQGRYLPAHRHACHQVFARKGDKSLIDRAEVTAARAKAAKGQNKVNEARGHAEISIGVSTGGPARDEPFVMRLPCAVVAERRPA